MFTSKHHPQGNGATSHCDNNQLEAAIVRFQSGDAGSLDEILHLARPRAETLIRFFKTNYYRPEDELLSDINFKLMRSIARFDARRATGFSYVSRIIESTLKTAVSNQRRNWSRYIELDETVASTLHTNGESESQDALDDFADRIKRVVKTTISDRAELQTMQWYVESFLHGAFELRRHKCCDAAMVVYQVGHERSRELYDLCLLECRRVMYDSLPSQPTIAAGRLTGTRSAWMLRYQPLLDSAEFEKFRVLTTGLSLFVVMLSNPESRSRRQDRNPPISRENLLWVIHGHPDAVKLFK